MSNIARRVQRAQQTTKKWAIKMQRKGAVLFGITGKGTLGQALTHNEIAPSNGVIKLPPGASYTLIDAGKVWINSMVCKDPGREVEPGDYIAVFPNEQMQLVHDRNGVSSIRMRAGAM